jgi:RHS repeat-associated protein
MWQSGKCSLGELVALATGSQGLFDFDFRKYRPAHGRWISPDPAGLAAVDPSDPQSWNRYAYVGNRPLNSVDPLGLDGCDPFFDVTCGPCDPSDASCEPSPPGCGPFFCRPIPPPGGGGPGPGRGRVPGGGGGSRIGGKWPNGETLGLPTGLNLHPMSLADLIGLSPSTSCDFGVCVTIAYGYVSGTTGSDGTSPFTIHVIVIAFPDELTPGARQVLGQVGQTAGQVSNPCTIVAFYVLSAASAVTASLASEGAVFPEIHGAYVNHVYYISQVNRYWRRLQPFQKKILGAVGTAAGAAAAAVQSQCNNF